VSIEKKIEAEQVVAQEAETAGDVVVEQAASIPEVTDTIATEVVMADVPHEEPVAEAMTEAAKEDVTVAEVPAESSAWATSATSPSYSVQIMALRKPVDLTYFRGLSDVTVTFSSDRWYRYTVGVTTLKQEAEKRLAELIDKGYADAFIRRKDLVPYFTIQVMAVPGPVVDLTPFSNLPEVMVSRGDDNFCRYFTGEFETKEEAGRKLTEVKRLGYSNAFIRKTGLF
jgi:hypothetical protein